MDKVVRDSCYKFLKKEEVVKLALSYAINTAVEHGLKYALSHMGVSKMMICLILLAL